MSKLQVVYLMNVVLYMKSFDDLLCFVCVSKDCKDACDGLKINPLYDSSRPSVYNIDKIIKFFPKIQTLVLPNWLHYLPNSLIDQLCYIRTTDLFTFQFNKSYDYDPYDEPFHITYDISSISRESKELYSYSPFICVNGNGYSTTIIDEIYSDININYLSKLQTFYVCSSNTCKFYIEHSNKLSSLKILHIVLHNEIYSKDSFENCFHSILTSNTITLIHMYSFNCLITSSVLQYFYTLKHKKIILHIYVYKNEHKSQCKALHQIPNVHPIFHCYEEEILINNWLITNSFDTQIKLKGNEFESEMTALHYKQRLPMFIDEIFIEDVVVNGPFDLSFLSVKSLHLSIQQLSSFNITLPLYLTSLELNCKEIVNFDSAPLICLESMNLVYLKIHNLHFQKGLYLNLKPSFKHLKFINCHQIFLTCKEDHQIDFIHVTNCSNCKIQTNICLFEINATGVISKNIPTIIKNQHGDTFYSCNANDIVFHSEYVRIQLKSPTVEICLKKRQGYHYIPNIIYNKKRWLIPTSNYPSNTTSSITDDINQVQPTQVDLRNLSIKTISLIGLEQPFTFLVQKSVQHIEMCYCMNVTIHSDGDCQLEKIPTLNCLHCKLINCTLIPTRNYKDLYSININNYTELQNMGVSMTKAILLDYEVDSWNINFPMNEYIFVNGSDANFIPDGICRIDGWSSWRRDLVELPLPNSLKHLSSYCFRGCNQLRSLNLFHVEIIQDKCFSDCTSLSAITLPSQIKEFGKNCFENCCSLTSLNIPYTKRIKKCWFNHCTNVVSIELPSNFKQSRFHKNFFSKFPFLKSLTIPSSIHFLDDRCFDSCYSLTSITIPPTVKRIGNNCFINCTSLQFIKLHDKLRVGNQCFRSKPLIRSFTLPTTIRSLNNEFFMNCSSLQSFIIPTTIKCVDSCCFKNCTSLQTISIPTSVKTLNYGCFSNCKSLTKIFIPSTVTILGGNCFNGCENLQSMNLFNSLKYMARRCFMNCCSLTTFTLSNNLKSIKHSCFKNCTSLQTITIPSSINALDDSCFENCLSLQSVDILDNAKYIGNNCFKNCTSILSITVGNKLTHIGDSCFSNCKSLHSVSLPYSLSSIGNDCFEYAGLTSLTIPSSLTTLSKRCFYCCQNLSSISLSSTLQMIETQCFAYCFKLKPFNIPTTISYDSHDVFFNTPLD